jgi:hypothetical protein
LREQLIELRGSGVHRFDTAWDMALERLGVPAGWQFRSRPKPDEAPESPLAFARRHFAAAWAGDTAARCEAFPGCLDRLDRRCPIVRLIVEREAAS